MRTAGNEKPETNSGRVEVEGQGWVRRALACATPLPPYGLGVMVVNHAS